MPISPMHFWNFKANKSFYIFKNYNHRTSRYFRYLDIKY